MRRHRATGALAVIATVIAIDTAVSQAPASQAAPTYRERYRPQYHFTPPTNWMNDPNGLVFYEGEYHLFYQYNPFGITWGHMSWGHAVSRDLVHWRHLPLAIPEVDGVMAFSGSAVVDWNNTSGFGQGGRPPLVAIYSGYRETDKNQSQNIAYSPDGGRTWTRYARNPVIDIGSTDFRDPKVFWYAPGRKWVMVVSLAAEHRMRFYSSTDLKRWTQMSEFGPSGAVGGAWECPDLFELPVDGNPRNTRWVLIVNINPGGIAGGSGTQYFIGRFDGTRFTPDATQASTASSRAGDASLWADYGKDFYAAVTWNDVPRADGRRILIGWMNNWQYGAEIPTAPWRSAQTIPRALALVSTRDGIRLAQRPVAELRRLRGTPNHVGKTPIRPGTTPLGTYGIEGSAIEILAQFEVGGATEVGLRVRMGKSEETVIGVDVRGGQLFVDRAKSGRTDFHRDFSGRQAAPLVIDSGRVRLHVFVDWSSVEAFAGAGTAVVTDQIFPSPESDDVSVYAVGGAARLLSLDAWPLRSVWPRAR